MKKYLIYHSVNNNMLMQLQYYYFVNNNNNITRENIVGFFVECVASYMCLKMSFAELLIFFYLFFTSNLKPLFDKKLQQPQSE